MRNHQILPRRTFYISIVLIACVQAAFSQSRANPSRELQQRLEAVEKRNNDLTAQNTALKMELDLLGARYESLNRTIEDNLQSQSNLISLLGLIVTILIFGASLYVTIKT